MTRVLLAGVSMRAAAESAVRAGFAVTAIDAFGDIDVPAAVRRLTPPDPHAHVFSAARAARAAAAIACDAVVYGSGFENDPEAVARLSAGRELWGNPPAVLRRVRDPRLLADRLTQRGWPCPSVAGRAPDSATAWLEKPLRSGGGRGVRAWVRGAARARATYLQERVDGIAGSVAFVAAHRRAVPLAVTRQLTGDAAFGARGYRYCGSILSPLGDLFDQDRCVAASAGALASAVADEFDLAGLNGIDFVARAGVALPIEVNPRWSASMELIERALGLSLFAVHEAACRRGALPSSGEPPAVPRAVGKAIVFARSACVAGGTRAWLDRPDVRDVPAPGTVIAAGAPICTVFADGASAAECYAALVRRAETVYAEVGSWQAFQP